MRHKYKILFLFVLQIGILLYLLTIKYDAKQDIITFHPFSEQNVLDTYMEEKEEIEITDIEDIKVKSKNDPLDKMYYADHKKAEVYPLFYWKSKKRQRIEKGLKLTFVHHAKDYEFACFYNTYPNVSLEDMGLKNKVENYQVTQLILWETAIRADDVPSEETAYLEAIRSDIGPWNINRRVFTRAQKILSFITESATYHYDWRKTVPVFQVKNAEAKRWINWISDDEHLYGPYRFYVTNSELIDFEANVVDNDTKESIPFTIKDQNGNEIDDLMEVATNKDVYFMLPYEPASMNIHVSATVKRPYAGIYKDQYGRLFMVKIYKEEEASGNIEVHTHF